MVGATQDPHSVRIGIYVSGQRTNCELCVLLCNSWCVMVERFRTISNLQRKPSVLSVLDPISEGRSSSCGRCSAAGDEVQSWEWGEVAAWLAEIGMTQYQSLFLEHAIESGRSLLQLEDTHLKEMGVAKIGHRLHFSEHLRELRRRARVTADGVDMECLLSQLDDARTARFMRRQPRRIILIRHAESIGNIDSSVYARIPDNKLHITEYGQQQAYAAGQQLKELINHESVTFYVSPFLRSRETYQQLRMCFHDEQVLCHREDPRLREQEWGNFQDPKQMKEIRKQRRETGAFYYRFPTGESGADVFDRVSMFLETLYRDMEKGLCGQNTIIVTHGLFCRLFLTRYYHWTVEKFHKLWNFDNCQFAIMELQPEGHYKLVSDLKSDP